MIIDEIELLEEITRGIVNTASERLSGNFNTESSKISKLIQDKIIEKVTSDFLVKFEREIYKQIDIDEIVNGVIVRLTARITKNITNRANT